MDVAEDLPLETEASGESRRMGSTFRENFSSKALGIEVVDLVTGETFLCLGPG